MRNYNAEIQQPNKVKSTRIVLTTSNRLEKTSKFNGRILTKTSIKSKFRTKSSYSKGNQSTMLIHVKSDYRSSTKCNLCRRRVRKPMTMYRKITWKLLDLLQRFIPIEEDHEIWSSRFQTRVQWRYKNFQTLRLVVRADTQV